MSAFTLEFTEDGRILAHATGKPVQVGIIAPEEPDQYGNYEWRALLWRYADTPGEFGRLDGKLDGKLAGLRYGTDARQCQQRVCARLRRGGPWWTAKEA